jgi:hypothetical protein
MRYIAISAFYYSKSQKIQRQNQLLSDIVGRGNQVLNKIAEDIRNAFIVLGDCSISELVYFENFSDTAKDKRIRIVTSEVQTSSALKPLSSGGNRYFTITRDIRLNIKEPLLICSEQKLFRAKAANIVTLTDFPDLKGLELESNIGDIDWDHPATVASTIERSYWIENINGISSLIMQEGKGEKMVLVKGVEDLQLLYHYSDNDKSDVWRSDQPLIGIEIGVRVLPSVFLQAKSGNFEVQEELRSGIKMSLALPYVYLSLLDSSHQLTIKSSANEEELDEVRLVLRTP